MSSIITEKITDIYCHLFHHRRQHDFLQQTSIFYIRVDEEYQNFYSIIFIIGEPNILCSVVCCANCVASAVLSTYGYYLIGCVIHDPSIVVFAQSTPRFKQRQQKTEKRLVQLFGFNYQDIFGSGCHLSLEFTIKIPVRTDR